jgi:hypothetical protein
MLVRRSTRDTPSVRGRERRWKSASDGSRRSRCCARFGTVASSRWAGSSPLPPLLITLSACEIWLFKPDKSRSNLNPMGRQKIFWPPADAVKALLSLTNPETGRGSKSHHPFFRSLLESCRRCERRLTLRYSPHYGIFTNSTRRFLARPASVLLSATGLVCPQPLACSRVPEMPWEVSHPITFCARASESS